MLRRTLCCVVLAVTLGTMSNAGQTSGVDRLDWISGCWFSDDGKERIEECWTRPAGKSMIGMSRTVAGGKTLSAEHIEIREVGGVVAYVVSPGIGAKATTFKLLRSTDNEVVFENPTHDFPQRIIYRRDSKDSLFARIEGHEKGVNKGIDFRYKRASCD